MGTRLSSELGKVKVVKGKEMVSPFTYDIYSLKEWDTTFGLWDLLLPSPFFFLTEKRVLRSGMSSLSSVITVLFNYIYRKYLKMAYQLHLGKT